MTAANNGGDGSLRGGSGSGGDGTDFSDQLGGGAGARPDRSARAVSPELAAATTLARSVVATPQEKSHRCATSFCGVDLTVLKKGSTPPTNLNRPQCEAQVAITEPVILSLDTDGVNYISENDGVSKPSDSDSVEELFPVAVDFSELLYVGTQQSCNKALEKGKALVCVNEMEGNYYSEDYDDFEYDVGAYRPEEHDGVQRDLQDLAKLKKEKMKEKGREL